MNGKSDSARSVPKLLKPVNDKAKHRDITCEEVLMWEAT